MSAKWTDGRLRVSFSGVTGEEGYFLVHEAKKATPEEMAYLAAMFAEAPAMAAFIERADRNFEAIEGITESKAIRQAAEAMKRDARALLARLNGEG